MAVSIMAGIPALKDINTDLRRRMDQAVASLQANLASTRTGRASVHMLDQVKVDYYGTHTPISQLAQVSAPEAQLILISPWDPTVLKEIEKALRTSDLGFNPQTDGKVIRIPIPPMTEERRREVCKHVNRILEEQRTAVRNVRRDGNDALKKLAKEKKNQRGRREALARRNPEADRRRDPPHGRADPQKRSRSHAGVRFPMPTH
jgi:ribosome recycling factor